MKWIDRMLHRHHPVTSPPESVLTRQDREELAAAKATHAKLLSRADAAIQEAMAHADELFRYRGPERRRHPR